MIHFSACLIIVNIALLWLQCLEGAEINCNRRPPPFINFQYCCQIPKARIELFPPQCRQFAQFNVFGQNKMCGLECMFSASSSLRDTTLNLDNVKMMLNQIYEDSDTADAKYSSYEECSSLIQEKLQNSQSINYPTRYRWAFGQQCSPYASIYALCAQIKMMKYCPESAWRNNQVCQSTKDFVENCEDQIF